MTNQDVKKPKPAKCKLCGRKYVSKQALIDHIGREHQANIPEGWSPARYECYLRTGKTTGYCVYCKKEVGFNEKSGKYNRMCGSAVCKKKARELASKNYIGLHGKPYTIDDPDVQRKMVYSKKNSGTYIFTDENTGRQYKVMYDSSFGKDFYQMLDLFLGWDGSDISGPSPHTYYYEYEGKKHFYVPDAYIHSLNLEVELKDGGDNPNTHPKIQAVDKVKEEKKDAVMLSLKDQVNYIKICNKDYKEFFALLAYLKDKDVCELPKWESRLESATYKNSVAESVTEGRDLITAQVDKVKAQVRLSNPDKLNYDKLILSYHNRLFHERLTRKDWDELYAELHSIELYLKKALNGRGEESSRMEYETRKALVEVQQLIHRMDDVGYRDCVESSLDGWKIATSGQFADYAKYADLDSAHGDIPVNESLIFTKDDIVYNLDSWTRKKGHNVLLITGLSGSGKTTTGYEMAYEYKAELFQLDWIQHPEQMQNSPETPNYGLWQYVKTRCATEIAGVEKASKQAATKNNLWHQIVLNVFHTILDFADANTSKLFIVEGVQIPGHLHDYTGIENFPIIIKGTSVIQSMARRINRDTLAGLDPHKTGGDNILKYYLDSEKYTNMFRDQISSYLSEAVSLTKPNYFYHLVPRGSNVANGITSLEYQYNHDRLMFRKNSAKYRDRLCNGWGIYPDRDPNSLTDKEVIDGICKFRNSTKGANMIYMFKYPPYSGLGPKMRDTLNGKDLYRIDLNALESNKLIDAIEFGHDLSNTDNPELTKTYYDTISPDGYFKRYTEASDGLLFASLNHIAVSPKGGKIPKKLIEKVAIPNTLSDITVDPISEKVSFIGTGQEYPIGVSFGNDIDNIRSISFKMTGADKKYLEMNDDAINELVIRNKLIYHEELLEHNKPVAFVMLVKSPNLNRCGQIVIGTLPESQRKGYGRILMNRMYDAVRNDKITGLDWILYGVNIDNIKSMDFARSVGFSEINDKQSDSIVYKKSIQSIYNGGMSPVTEAKFIEVFKNEERCYPIFVFLSYTHSRMATLIKNFTGDPYAHSSISFDTSLENMVSFDSCGMVVENIHKDIYDKNKELVRYSLYMYIATEEEYLAMRKFVDELLGKQGQLKYNLLGLTNFIFGRGSEREDRFFCSEFVSAAIAAGNSKIFDRPPYMIQPYYFAKNKHFIFIKTGILKNYDQRQVDKIVDKKLIEGGYDNVKFDYTGNR